MQPIRDQDDDSAIAIEVLDPIDADFVERLRAGVDAIMTAEEEARRAHMDHSVRAIAEASDTFCRGHIERGDRLRKRDRCRQCRRFRKSVEFLSYALDPRQTQRLRWTERVREDITKILEPLSLKAEQGDSADKGAWDVYFALLHIRDELYKEDFQYGSLRTLGYQLYNVVLHHCSDFFHL